MTNNNSSYKPNDYEFGVLIQSYRKKTRLTQKALSDLVGVSKRTVAAWEAGQNYPKINHLHKLLEIFLKKSCFTPNEELTEAQSFWEKATRTQIDGEESFNARWFNNLLYQGNSLVRPLMLPYKQDLVRQDWSEAVDNRALYGRERELTELENWIIKDKYRLISIFGLGGIGKTGLVVSLTHQVAMQFDYVIFRTLQSARPLDELLDSILGFVLEGQLATIPTLQSEKLALVMNYFRQYRCLLVLDNLETILQDGLNAGEYRDGYADYDDFIRRLCDSPHKSCLLITSREKPRQLGLREEKTGAVRALALKGLDKKSCQAVLNSMNINSSEEHGDILAKYYGGNPLALKLIAEPIREFFEGNIQAFLASEGFRYGEINYILDQHFARLSVVEQDILYWLALRREPLTIETLQNLSVLKSGITALSDGLRALTKRFLVEQNDDRNHPGFILQGVVLEYVTNRLISHLHGEIISQTPDLLQVYPLLQTQAREYIRQMQLRVFVKPLLDQLQTTLKNITTVTQYLKQLLDSLRNLPQNTQAYAGGNLVNLLIQAGFDLSGWDLGNLVLWQTHLSGVELHGVNLTGANLTGATFTEAYLSAYSLAYSPDGTKLAIGCANGSIKVWQVGEVFRAQLLECQGHTNLVATVKFSPKGNLLASGSADGTVRLWEPQSGLCLAVLEGPTAIVRSVAFSPDGKWLACGGDDQHIWLWQVSNGRLIKSIAAQQGWIMSLMFSPDGKLLATGGVNSTIKLWDVSAPSTEVKPIAVLSGHDQRVHSVVFSPDGKLLASGSTDRTVRLWSVTRKACISILMGHIGIVISLAFSPDGKLLVSGGAEGTIRVWSVANSSIQRSVPASNATVMSLAFNPDGATFASGSAEISNVKLWSVKNLEVLDVLQGFTSIIYTIAVSPDDKWLVVGSTDYHLLAWDLTNPLQSAPRSLRGHTGFTLVAAFSSDAKTVASGNGDTTIRLWNLVSGKCWCTLTGNEHPVSSIAFSPNNRLLISGDEGGNLKVWSIITGENLSGQIAHQGWIRKLVLSPDGQTLASGAEDGFIKLWEVNSENTTIRQVAVWPNQSDMVLSLAFNHDGSLLFSGGSDGAIRCWAVRTKELIGCFEAHPGMIWGMDYSPDKQYLATAGGDSFVRLWNIAQVDKVELVASFEQDTKAMTVAFTSKGERLYSAGEDGKIKLWELNNNSLVTTLNARSPYEGLNITGITGLTPAQRLNLLSLGAIEKPVRAS